MTNGGIRFACFLGRGGTRIGLLGLGEPSFSLRSLFSERGEMKKWGDARG